MGLIDLKIFFEDALGKEMSDYRTELCRERYGCGYSNRAINDDIREMIDEEVGRKFAKAIRKMVENGDG